MVDLLMVAIGGAVGAAARYAVGQAIARRTSDTYYATLIVNLSGSLLLGMMVGASLQVEQQALYALLGIGLIGGFTTYSTLMVQTVMMAQQRSYRSLLLYLMYTFAGGLLLAGIGFSMMI
ncbi:fluoride efflux transporter FluC [Paenibacillus abyssi]|uniref:Fluoride-specific ion channel FluC n=1 Tax=Paenibacillus abyssi TaxID=1340531 RepID=A0A917D456_9BACL|nr:CrcB family protein [Paenibacillus abyssi]GGG09483.1 hypothetical protein GCM10010916_27900 [Paenibacillus abyssi]